MKNSGTQAPAHAGRGRAAAEIAVLLAAVLGDQWFLSGLGQVLWELPAYAVVAAVFLVSLRRRGILSMRLLPRSGPTLRAYAETFAVTAGLAAAVLILAWAVHQPYDELPRALTSGVSAASVLIGRHVVWAVLQQLLLQLFLRPLIVEVLARPTSATPVAALVFGLLHLPCSVLVAAAVICSACWMALYARHRSLRLVIASHALLSTLAVVSLQPQWTCGLDVGIVALRNAPRYEVLKRPETIRLLTQFTQDDYYRSNGDTDSGFIRALYRDMLGRAPTDQEVRSWVDRMNDGSSRVRIAKAFATSDEYLRLASRPAAVEKEPR